MVSSNGETIMGMMMIKAAAAAAAAMVGLGLAAAYAVPVSMPTGGRSTQPVGHYDFCMRSPAECTPTRGGMRAPVELTRGLWADLIEVNNLVNMTVVPMTDMEIWGREEHWSYPVDGIGDCEDFVLEKRRILMEKGLHPRDLLITVVRQPNGDGHAVLTVRTSLGDFILDNLEPRILAWHDTEYEFLKRQSERDPGAWLSIHDGRSMAVGSVR
jgi:predicted transglutaminase-like cysteine proteinase